MGGGGAGGGLLWKTDPSFLTPEIWGTSAETWKCNKMRQNLDLKQLDPYCRAEKMQNRDLRATAGLDPYSQASNLGYFFNILEILDILDVSSNCGTRSFMPSFKSWIFLPRSTCSSPAEDYPKFLQRRTKEQVNGGSARLVNIFEGRGFDKIHCFSDPLFDNYPKSFGNY